MILLFVGLTAANLTLMLAEFILGTFTLDPNNMRTMLYPYHAGLGISVALVSTLTHVTVYTYFMASTKWLRAATDKANLDPAVYVDIPTARKRRVLPVAMLAIASTMACVFAGAWVDQMLNEDWAHQLHLATAGAAIVVNLICAWAEYTLIWDQSRLMKTATDVFVRSTP